MQSYKEVSNMTTLGENGRHDFGIKCFSLFIIWINSFFTFLKLLYLTTDVIDDNTRSERILNIFTNTASVFV